MIGFLSAKVCSLALAAPVSNDKIDPVGKIRLLKQNFAPDSLRKYYLLDSRNSYHLFMKNDIVCKGRSWESVAGITAQGRIIKMHFFPGSTDKRALVIGGVHGTELSSVKLAEELMNQLTNASDISEYSLLVIPELFPDNAATARLDAVTIGSVHNIGRYSSVTSADPNRQMPALGKAFNEKNPVDALGRLIENENQVLLSLIRDFLPERIINLHAIRDIRCAGIFADPRTDASQVALGYSSDSILAIGMAKYIVGNGGNAPGNHLDTRPNALYHHDPPIAEPGFFQKRNFSGSCLTAGRGNGVSLGSWAATAVQDSLPGLNRPAITMLTLEFPGCKRPGDYADPAQREVVSKQIKVYAEAIRYVFLRS